MQCHGYNWEYEPIPHVVANLLVADLRHILKCAIFLRQNRVLLLTEDLDLASRYKLHENVREYVDVDFVYKHFKCKFTISHVGHYPDLVDIATLQLM